MVENCENFACVFATDGKCVDGKPCVPASCGGPACFTCKFHNDCEREGNK